MLKLEGRKYLFKREMFKGRFVYNKAYVTVVNITKARKIEVKSARSTRTIILDSDM